MARPKSHHGPLEGYDRFLLCHSKPPTQLSPSDFPVSKIRIYFPAYFHKNYIAVTKPNNNHQSLPNKNNNNSDSSHSNSNKNNHHFNHHHRNIERNYDTLSSTTTSTSASNGVATTPASTAIKPKITETDVDDSDYSDESFNVSSEDNFIEILFHLPNYFKNPSL